jgi:hypothetical protein
LLLKVSNNFELLFTIIIVHPLQMTSPRMTGPPRIINPTITNRSTAPSSPRMTGPPRIINPTITNRSTAPSSPRMTGPPRIINPGGSAAPVPIRGGGVATTSPATVGTHMRMIPQPRPQSPTTGAQGNPIGPSEMTMLRQEVQALRQEIAQMRQDHQALIATINAGNVQMNANDKTFQNEIAAINTAVQVKSPMSPTRTIPAVRPLSPPTVNTSSPRKVENSQAYDQLMRNLASYDKSIEDDSVYPDSYYQKAKTLEEINKLTHGGKIVSDDNTIAALQNYTAAIDLDRTNPLYYVNRAKLYANVGDSIAASQDLTLALTLDKPTDPTIKRYIKNTLFELTPDQNIFNQY